MKAIRGTLYFHYPCFDGLVSAAIASHYLENAKGWHIASARPINYDRARAWLEAGLPKHSAVVDFLYHPGVEFWADHHTTAFLTEESRASYLRRADDGMSLYDERSLSCAMLLWRHLHASLSDSVRFEEMAIWADRIDGAQYASVNEAVFGTAPAIQINLSLTGRAGIAYSKFLLAKLRAMTLSEVAVLPEVELRAGRIRKRLTSGLRLVGKGIRLEDGEIARFAADQGRNAIISRYSAFYFLPAARYSLGLVRSKSGAKITAMRNPWRDFESVHLGKIFQEYGGGGHQRVASVIVPRDRDAGEILAGIEDAIRTADAGVVRGDVVTAG